MIGDNKIKISIIVEDQKLQDYIVLILMGEDYKVKAHATQNEALMSLEEESPNLIITEFESPHINGLDICKVVRKNFLFGSTPIILILQDAEPINIAKLIYAGADDYIKKGSIENELLLRIKLSLYRKARERGIHPLTGLPGQFALWQELEKRIESKALFAVCCADLFRLKDFNQRYDFKKGDEVIKYTASLILKTLQELGSPSDFLSHPQNDDFFFITPHDGAVAIADKIIKIFDLNVTSLYDVEDRKRGYILIKNRKGEIQRIPFLRIYIGIVTNENYPFFNPTQIIQTANELKDFAQKKFEKSMYVKERRKSYPFY